MAEENAVVTTETVNEVEDISEEQVNEFFENGGLLPEEETPEPEKEPEPEPEKEPEKEKFVPYGALHEERQKRKELQTALEQMRAEQAQSAQVMQQVLQQMRQQNQPPEPTIDDDPVAYFKSQQEKHEKALAELAQQQQERQQQEQQQQQFSQFVSAYRQAAQEYVKEAPDFNDAYQYAIKHRSDELKAAGYPDDVIPQILRANEAEIVELAFRNGENPAKKIYEIAKLRGWSKAPPAEEKMQTLSKGVKASKPSTGGAPQGGDITLEALAEAADSMDADEFNTLWAKFAKTQR